MRIGFGGDDAPRAVFPSLIGKVSKTGMRKYNVFIIIATVAMVGIGNKDYWIGDEANSQRGLLKLDHPQQHGVVTNWDNMERVIHHMLYSTQITVFLL